MKNEREKTRITLDDQQVDTMVRNWDKIRCKRCGKVISMLNAKQLKDGSGFVCKGH